MKRIFLLLGLALRLCAQISPLPQISYVTVAPAGSCTVGQPLGLQVVVSTLAAWSCEGTTIGGAGTWTLLTSSSTGVTSVTFTGGLISVANTTTTPAFTVAGTSGGIPYFSSASTWASSGALTVNVLPKGGGAGAAPSNSSITDNGTTVSTPEAIATTSSVSAGSSPPTCTAGTGGGACFGEGTALTATSAVDMIYADSTIHSLKASVNNGSFWQIQSLPAVGTAPTITGCGTISAQHGGITQGDFTTNETGTCAAAFALPTAPTGWVCYATDITKHVATNIMMQSATSTTSCTVTGTTAASDVLTFSAFPY